jgi:5-methylcytosine-specific restriction endonuclease McrA
MKAQNSRCLLLNADFSPLSIIHWKKAVIWHMKYEDDSKYGIDIVDFYKNDHINGVNNKKYPIPAVARTKKYFKSHKQTVTFSRKNIFIRDEYTCQYCGLKFDRSYLTYDHVIPKSIWHSIFSSPTCWTNIVTACVSCNRKKGNKTPKQANMPLINIPIKPTKTPKYLPVAHHLHKIKTNIPTEWKIYLPESYYA